MYKVYILYSLKDRRLYVGCTANLEKRIDRHNEGKVISTKNRRPLELIHSESFNNKITAFNRERFLKSLWSAKFKRKILTEYLEIKSKIQLSNS